MCGFFLAINDTTLDIKKITESFKHRGPDSTGFFTGKGIQCGFNRLMIVDNDPQSDQPMLDSSGRYLLVFNGQIYNYKDLKKNLEKTYPLSWSTQSDTEVLLHGLIHEGISFIKQLDGIFAFAFIDLESLDVILARDMFGVKPLYFYTIDQSIYISSELKPVYLATGNKIDFSNMSQFLTYGFVDKGNTLLSNINILEANCIMLLNPEKKPQTFNIHHFIYDVYDTIELNHIQETLYKTIDTQKPSISYGILFSGGLDSTLLLKQCVHDPHFSAAYSVEVNHPDMSEKYWQEYAVNVLKIEKKYQRIDLTKEHFTVENMDHIAKRMDCPLFHPNFIGSFLLTQLANKNNLKVLLSGEGADELFMGYKWFFSQQPVSDFLEYIPLQHIQKILGVEAETISIQDETPLLEIFQKKYLQRWLLRQDVTGMANSIETRVPFLGLSLAQLMNKLSYAFKKGQNQSKWIIKKFLSDTFPHLFLERKKIGFDFPLNEWIGIEHIDYLKQKSHLIDSAMLDFILKKEKKLYLKKRLIFSLVAFCLWQDNLAK